MFGPYTLDAYIQQFSKLASNLVRRQRVDPGPKFPDLLDKQISLKPGVVLDTAPLGTHFGDCVHDALSQYYVGDEVQLVFITGHPRNNLQLESTYLSVEKFDAEKSEWNVVATDANWETK